MKTKKAVKKAKVEKDEFGCRKGSLSSQVMKALSAGKPVKEVSRKFKTISISKLLKDVKARGVKFNPAQAPKAKGKVKKAKAPVEAPASGPKVEPAPTA